MNYRHAYHAGNFADCFKHALLVALVENLARKPAPFFVLDTHAGAGIYDLEAQPARRTAEADSGIHRVRQSRSVSLGRYLQLVQLGRVYPGSPVLISNLMRDGDRLSCCETHPEDITILRKLFIRNRQVDVHERSGWEAIGSLLPPSQKRGLVFIDPPFEDPTEFSKLADGLRRGHQRFAHGVFASWYPIKNVARVREFITNLRESSIRDILGVELYLREPADASLLNGCGMLVINPPYKFSDHALEIADAILAALDGTETGASARVFRIANE